VTKNAVIGSPEKKFKASIRSEHLLARIALIDAELHVGTPKEVTAASGMDALCQCIEAFTSTGASAITDRFATGGFGAAVRSLYDAFKDGGNVEAREQMAYAALCSGVALANAGLGAVHGFAAPIGANFPVPHGVVCARLLPPVLVANVNALRASDAKGKEGLLRYRKLGTGITLALVKANFCEKLPEDPHETLVIFIQRLMEGLVIPRLSDFGLRDEHVPAMVELAKKASSMRYNPVVLADDVLANILRSAL
jgi:alcohol dehydrogenase class IV